MRTQPYLVNNQFSTQIGESDQSKKGGNGYLHTHRTSKDNVEVLKWKKRGVSRSLIIEPPRKILVRTLPRRDPLVYHKMFRSPLTLKWKFGPKDPQRETSLIEEQLVGSFHYKFRKQDHLTDGTQLPRYTSSPLGKFSQDVGRDYRELIRVGLGTRVGRTGVLTDTRVLSRRTKRERDEERLFGDMTVKRTCLLPWGRTKFAGRWF